MSSGKRVIVLGGGVAGLSAAHELVERGFEVEVFEHRGVPGGKARSIPVPNTGTDGRPDLPGEHGFRFFPGFYKHLPDTMKRIPFAGNAQGVFDNLVPTTQVMVCRVGRTDPVFPAHAPETPWQLYEMLKTIWDADLGIPAHEALFFADRLWTIMTSCQERRLAEYEKISWWDFIEAKGKSPEYIAYLARGLTRSLVAMKAEEASTRTVGDILIQLFLDMWARGAYFDRVLNAPTNEAWIDPWRAYLQQRGVRVTYDTRVSSLSCVDGRITEVLVTPRGPDGGDGAPYPVAGDYYVLAVPIERATPLLNTPSLRQADPSFRKLEKLRVEWMNGMQLFFDVELPMAHGHALYVDAPWALTSISQGPFWREKLSSYGAGNVRGVLSVDISDWTTPGILYGKPAAELNDPELLFNEVFAQLRASLSEPRFRDLDRAHLVKWFLDPDIIAPNPSGVTNLEPLLVNFANSWQFRPETATALPNLFLAADYVRTYTDLATMEGANEAARRAVNGVLAASGSSEEPCALWPLEELALLAPLRAYDKLRFALGLPHGKCL